jgi:hypothetical protein
MPISYSETSVISCPECGAEFSAEIWLLLDAQEEPAQATALKSGRLNMVHCPACGRTGPAAAPLLYHDAAARTVIFAAAPGAAEHEWHDQARDLHALLVGSVPLEQRRAYLSDVQVAHDLGGVVRLIERAERRKRPPDTVSPPPSAAATAAPGSNALLAAVEALLAANDNAELQEVVARHPLLTTPETDAALAQLAAVAADQGERDIAESLTQARFLLTQLRTADSVPTTAPAAPATVSDVSDEDLYQQLLHRNDAAALTELAGLHPRLLAVEFLRWLAELVDQALDAENERLAARIDERREALLQLQTSAAEPTGAHELETALETLLVADDEDAIANAIDRYPVLLTETAEQALWQFAAEARAGGDEEIATYAIECRALLRRVREGLEAEQ